MGLYNTDFTKVYNYAEFEVLTAVNAKTAVFWVVAPCGLQPGR
jgi:hypothetical protein